MTEIINYHPKYADDFKRLNVAWLEKFFVVEKYDEEVLSNPQKYILDKGGDIYFILENDTAKGTFALMYNEYEELEFTKMAVDESAQGQGFGNLLMQHCIDKAKEMGAENLILYSSRNSRRQFHFTENSVLRKFL